MQKYFLSIYACFSWLILFGQHSIDSLVQTERRFANTSVKTRIRDAFLQYIDTVGIVFDKGQPVNGFQLYSHSDRAAGVLDWEPEFVEISSGNDFGYTTGPWNYYAKTVKDTPLAQGHFITVWHLTDENKWKFLIDFGIGYGEERKQMPLKKVQTASSNLKPGDQESLKEAEEEFIRSYLEHKLGAYDKFLSANSRLNYKGFLPAVDEPARKQLLDSLPSNIHYTVVGCGVSPAKDMGYVYGTMTVNNIQDGYLRIWRREKNGWKIAVEVLHFN